MHAHADAETGRSPDQPEPGGPIFVVGAARSGTTLMVRILSGHSAVWICNETHHFEDLRPRLGRRGRAPLGEVERRRCEEFFAALSRRPGHRRHSEGDASPVEITLGEIRAEARRRGDDADAYFEAYCRIAAARRGRTRWGEKTPRHVFRIAEMLGRFPDAQVVCMVRDPRAFAVSYREAPDPYRPGHRWRWRRNPILVALLWRSAAAAGLRARRRFGADRVRLVRYEDLVAEPEARIAALAEWLGLSYEAGMLRVSLVVSSFEPVQRGSGIATRPVDRWRDWLVPDDVGVIETVSGAAMEELGYARETRGVPWRALAADLARAPMDAMNAVASNRGRRAAPLPYVARRVRIALDRHPR